ncbi:phospholipase D family protein [Bacillus canaveralius]|uniref:phospholipase D family protein n=1 Tax=Bacillus canaveralius TaxID=1403243 RepID=UPI000F774280|nr:phospholipase D family protein [Bacillus canaveralius]RSK52844.1 phospholipase [Bacillus canaveralius]
MNKLKILIKKKRVWIPLLVIAIISTVIIYNRQKPLPPNISYEGKVHTVQDASFLYDLTYKDENGRIMHDQHIFDTIFEAIRNAEQYIVIDMFLFNGYTQLGKDFPEISAVLTKELIKKKQENNDIKIIFITDEINTTYNSHRAKELTELKKHGIETVYTNVDRLRDSNPLYSGIWRTFIHWFGQNGNGWMPNPLAETAPDVTMRSYLKLLNIKANHRKVFVSEKTAIISSANPHDESANHSNIAFQVSGNIINDILESEQAVSNISNGPKLPEFQAAEAEPGPVKIQLLTEGKIPKHILSELNDTKKGDIVWLGMFYLADRHVIDHLKEAADRGVNIRLILDPNKNAFGSEKIGLPNIPVAAELDKLGHDHIHIRWYDIGKEQFHSKLMFIKKENNGVIIGGSANFTARNLNDLNLETDIKITAPPETDIYQDVDSYFERIWDNKNGRYTVDYEADQNDLPVFKYLTYLIQKATGFTTY